MKEDKLEEWIKKNASLRDVETPDDVAIWEGIRAGLTKKKGSSLNWLYWAAVLIPVIGLSTYFYYSSGPIPSKEKILSNQQTYLTAIGPEWATLETNYQQNINSKWAEIEKEKFATEEFDFLFEELGILDEVNTKYQSDLSQVENERLVRTLIDYYEKKTRLLEKILIEIEREKQQKHERHSIEL